jgi:hypothetical protein
MSINQMESIRIGKRLGTDHQQPKPMVSKKIYSEISGDFRKRGIGASVNDEGNNDGDGDSIPPPISHMRVE